MCVYVCVCVSKKTNNQKKIFPVPRAATPLPLDPVGGETSAKRSRPPAVVLTRTDGEIDSGAEDYMLLSPVCGAARWEWGGRVRGGVRWGGGGGSELWRGW